MLESVYLIIFAGCIEEAVEDRVGAIAKCRQYNDDGMHPDDMEDGSKGYWSYSEVPFRGDTFWQVYRCERCGEIRTWCDGGTDNEYCDKCWVDKERPWWFRLLGRLWPSGPGRHGCDECKELENG